MIDPSRYHTSRFLKAQDLPASATTVTITGVREERLQANTGESKLKLILELQGHKPLVLNVTNLDAVCDALGKEESEWLGQQVRLLKRKEKYQGQTFEVIRIEAAPKPNTEDGDVPF